ncbi:MAG: branched-chain amino acid aminotransferase [Myxococcota bacterium]|jgi:branched-chain amino acid aminotransferase
MTHTYLQDPRNDGVLVYINGDLVPRPEAKVSVLDSGFMLGDGVWESFRVRDGAIAFLDEHLDRLFEGCAALHLDPGLDRTGIVEALRTTLQANKLRDAHVRLMLTRGLRSTPYQSPRVVVGGPTLVILPEIKALPPDSGSHPMSLFTVHVRRGRPDVQDPGINSHSKLNCILACIQAHEAGADEGLMLDPHGFVATCNSTHFFIVRRGEVWTSSGDYCLPGITRASVLRVAREAGIPAVERNFTLRHVYAADEAFVTGTFGGLTPVGTVDGRSIGARGPITERLQGLYSELARREATPLW